MRSPRLSTRRLMATVAVVAVVLTTGIVGRRWLQYSTLARAHGASAFGYALEASNSYELAYDDMRSGHGEASARPFVEEGDVFRKQGLYHEALRRKYEGAMWRPWLRVPPDPPPP